MPRISSLFCLLFFTTVAQAQLVHFELPNINNVDSLKKEFTPNVMASALEYRLLKPSLSPKQIKKNNTKMAVLYPVAYGGILGGLGAAWYSNFERTKLKSFNDSKEWLQVDKLGHWYGTYIFSKAAMELWYSTGGPNKRSIWLGGLSGLAFQTAVEVLDGHSKQWGFSWSDMGANVLGSGLLISQELAWHNQRIELKMGFSPKRYAPDLKERVNSLYGTNPLEQFVKDYNAQTIWLSANVHDFFPNTNLPKWLSFSVGYGGDGMLGANNNLYNNAAGMPINRSDVKRVRQFYFAPDIKLTKIRVRKQWQRAALTFLNAFKFPLPAIELNSGGKAKFHFIKF
jgi:hypothetical protein